MDNRFEVFTYLIAKLHKNINKIKNKEMSKYNLKGIHVSIIYYLAMYETLTARELCEKCEEDKGTISRALHYLEHNNFVSCESKYNKRYNSPFILTTYGKEVANEINLRIENVLDEINEIIDNNDRKKFYDYLINISDKLEKINNKTNK